MGSNLTLPKTSGLECSLMAVVRDNIPLKDAIARTRLRGADLDLYNIARGQYNEQADVVV